MGLEALLETLKGLADAHTITDAVHALERLQMLLVSGDQHVSLKKRAPMPVPRPASTPRNRPLIEIIDDEPVSSSDAPSAVGVAKEHEPAPASNCELLDIKDIVLFYDELFPSTLDVLFHSVRRRPPQRGTDSILPLTSLSFAQPSCRIVCTDSSTFSCSLDRVSDARLAPAFDRSSHSRRRGRCHRRRGASSCLSRRGRFSALCAPCVSALLVRFSAPP
jgi:hypothetical protein